MSVDIGPRIGIDGEKEFRQNIANINQQLRTLGSEMQAVTSQFDANDRSQEALAAQTNVLNRQIDAQQQKLQQLQHGLEESTRLYGENDTRTLRWAQAVNEAQADLNRMRNRLRDLDGGLDDTSDSMEEAGAASEGLGERFSVLTVAVGHLIADGIETLISAVGDLISTVWNMDEATEEFRQAMGRLNTAFETAGYSTDDARQAYQDFYGILGDTDTATEASQLLARLADDEKDLAEWTRIAAGVNGTFGDSLPIEGLIEAANETARTGEVTGSLADALNWAGSVGEEDFNTMLENCSTEAERNQLIMETLTATYGEAADAFYRNNETLVASRNAQAALDEAVAQLGGTIAGVKAELSADYLPTLTSLIGITNDFISGNTSFGEALTQVGNSVGQFIQQLGQTFSQLLPSVMEGLSTLGAMAPQIISTLAQGLTSSVPQLANAAVSLIESLASYIQANFPQLLQTAVTFMADFSGTLRENVGLLADAALDLISSLAQGIADGIPTLVENIPEIVSNIANIINDNAPKIVETGISIIVTLVQGLIEAIPTIIENIPQIIGAIVDTLMAFNWVNLGSTVIKGLSNGLKAAITFVKEAADNIVNVAKTNISQLPSAMKDIGKNIVQGLINGIKSAGTWLKDNLLSWCSGIVDTVTEALGISSPSKVFEDEVGRYMAQGIGVGFEDEMANVASRMQKAIPTPTIETVQSAAAGMVNGLSALNSGYSFPREIVLTLENGQEIARWLLPYNRAAARANPEVARA